MFFHRHLHFSRKINLINAMNHLYMEMFYSPGGATTVYCLRKLLWNSQRLSAGNNRAGAGTPKFILIRIFHVFV